MVGKTLTVGKTTLINKTIITTAEMTTKEKIKFITADAGNATMVVERTKNIATNQEKDVVFVAFLETFVVGN